MQANSRYIADFSQIYRMDEDLVGKKAHELGILWKLGIPLPKGFVITNIFFKDFLFLTGIDKEIKAVKTLSHPALSDSVKNLSHDIQKHIMYRHIPKILTAELHKSYRRLSGTFREKPVDMFSSTFNNKTILFPNVKGDANFVLKIKKIWSLSFGEPVAVAVQENISPEIKGKVFTDNPNADKRLTNAQMEKLADYCKIIQKYFYFPKEIEYAVKKGRIFVTKVNPFTETISKSSGRKILIKGMSVNPGIVTGPVKILNDKSEVVKVKRGEIAVMPDFDLSLFKKVKNAKAIVVDSATARSLNKAFYRKSFYNPPAIIGVKNATRVFRNGNVVTVNGMSGEIYSGGLLY